MNPNSARDAEEDGVEFASLLKDDSSAAENRPSGPAPRAELRSSGKQYFWPAVLTAVIALSYFFFIKKEASGLSQDGNDPVGHSPKVNTKGKKNKKAKYRDVRELREAYDLGRQRMVDRLKRDYTEELYHKMFEVPASSGDGSVVSAGRFTFVSASGKAPNVTEAENPSWNRLVRKMMMKLLQVQMHDEKQSELHRLLRSNETLSDENRQRILQLGVSGDNLTDAAVTFIWVRFISLLARR
jgi:hypothetical protein